MNWTGGALQRGRKARGTAVSKQKEHFAKVRNGLHGRSHSDSPRRIEVLGKTIVVKPSTRHHSAKVSAVPLEALQPSTVGRHTSWSSSYQRQRLLVPSTTHHDESIIRSEEQNPISYENHIPASSGGLQYTLSNSDIQKQETNPLSTLDQADELGLLEARRKRLLAQQDWLETKPVKRHRPRPKTNQHNPRFGRRRRVSDEVTRPPILLQQQHQSPVLHPPRDNHHRLGKDKHYAQPSHGMDPPREVRISIGNKQIMTGISSSAHHVSSNKDQVHSASLQGSCSDIMLLDQEPVYREDPPRRAEQERHVRDLTNVSRSHSHELKETSLALYNQVLAAFTNGNNSDTAVNGLPTYANHQHDGKYHFGDAHERAHTPFYFADASSVIAPIPHSARTSRLINPVAQSDVATCGVPAPESASRTTNNQLWKSWLAPSMAQSQRIDALEVPRISPGGSTGFEDEKPRSEHTGVSSIPLMDDPIHETDSRKSMTGIRSGAQDVRDVRVDSYTELSSPVKSSGEQEPPTREVAQKPDYKAMFSRRTWKGQEAAPILPRPRCHMTPIKLTSTLSTETFQAVRELRREIIRPEDAGENSWRKFLCDGPVEEKVPKAVHKITRHTPAQPTHLMVTSSQVAHAPSSADSSLLQPLIDNASRSYPTRCGDLSNENWSLPVHTRVESRDPAFQGMPTYQSQRMDQDRATSISQTYVSSEPQMESVRAHQSGSSPIPISTRASIDGAREDSSSLSFIDTGARQRRLIFTRPAKFGRAFGREPQDFVEHIGGIVKPKRSKRKRAKAPLRTKDTMQKRIILPEDVEGRHVEKDIDEESWAEDKGSLNGNVSGMEDIEDSAGED